MATKIYLPLEDETDDVVVRMTEAEAVALYSLCSKLSYDELMAKGLTLAQCKMITMVAETFR